MGGGRGGKVPAHTEGGRHLCGSTAHERSAQVLSDQENLGGAVPGAGGAPFIPSHLFCISEDTAGGILRYWPALSVSVEASLGHTHTQELRARQMPFVNLKETATERVRLQEILPFPLTRRHGACPSRV